MFSGCTSLESAPSLNSTSLAPNCYMNMFTNCTSLRSAPLLPAETLSAYCYFEMYEGCTNLEYIQGLPADTLDSHCYGGMFKGCSRFTHMPDLPATELAEGCYERMFYETGIGYVQALPAETLVKDCYKQMFYNCAQLSSINASFTTTPGTEYTTQWVKGVSSEGTFIKNTDATWDVSGVNGVPDGWTVDYRNETRYFTFKALEDSTFSFTKPGLMYSLNDSSNWTSLEEGGSVTVSAGERVSWKGTMTPYGTEGIGTFTATGRFKAEGNTMSLLYGDSFNGKTSIGTNSYTFRNLFNDCRSLIDATHISLPASELTSFCYFAMFKNCSNLTGAPELPATVLSSGCYEDMFSGCGSLATAPALLSTSLNAGCYENMFFGCASLTSAPELPATLLSAGCYVGMFKDCVGLTAAPVLASTTMDQSCYQEMFSGCRNLTTPPQLPAVTLSPFCYNAMFKDCTSLVRAPELLALELVDSCYKEMFSGCSSLNYIKVMFTTTPGENYTKDWVNGVASSGEFVKNASSSWHVSGVDGTPEGWTVTEQNV